MSVELLPPLDEPCQSKNSSSVTIIFGNGVNADVVMEWMQEKWALPYGIVICYLISIFGIQHLMKSRKAFQLKRSLLAWNTLLACYSLFTTYHLFSRYIPYLKCHALSTFLCDNSATRNDSFTTLVAFAFALSKIVELGDTFFIVLRKRRLIFLHWYHHVTALLLTWRVGMEGASIVQYASPVNTFIHSVMYTYFALKCLEIKVPKFVSMSITFMQILQMFFALAVISFMFVQKLNGQLCHVTEGFLKFATIIYISYAYLFVRFFLDSYVWNSKQKNGKSTKME